MPGTTVLLQARESVLISFKIRRKRNTNFQAGENVLICNINVVIVIPKELQNFFFFKEEGNDKVKRARDS